MREYRRRTHEGSPSDGVTLRGQGVACWHSGGAILHVHHPQHCEISPQMSTIHNTIHIYGENPQYCGLWTFVGRIHNILDLGHLWAASTTLWIVDICGENLQYCRDSAGALPRLCRDSAETCRDSAETYRDSAETCRGSAGALPELCRYCQDSAGARQFCLGEFA